METQFCTSFHFTGPIDLVMARTYWPKIDDSSSWGTYKKVRFRCESHVGFKDGYSIVIGYLIGGLEHCLFFHNIWDVILPIDELHHFSKWLLHHQAFISQHRPVSFFVVSPWGVHSPNGRSPCCCDVKNGCRFHVWDKEWAYSRFQNLSCTMYIAMAAMGNHHF